MVSSRQLAGLIGPTLVVLTVTETINIHIWDVPIPAVTYLNGTLLLVAGLAIVRAHNRWMRGWPVLLTIVGWGALLLGLYRMIAPEAPQATAGPATYAGLGALFVTGAILTFKAYWREQKRASAAAAVVVDGAERGHVTFTGDADETRTKVP